MAANDYEDDVDTMVTFRAPSLLIEDFGRWTKAFGNLKQSVFHRLWMLACIQVDADAAWIRDLYELARRRKTAPEAAEKLLRYLEAGAAADQRTKPAEEADVDAEDRKRLDALEEKLSKLADAFDKVFGGDTPEPAPTPKKKPKGSGGKKR